MKFQDSEEITNIELADAFEQMWSKRRYHEIFFMIDTCQAASMYQEFYSPNILAVASSLVGKFTFILVIDNKKHYKYDIRITSKASVALVISK